VAGQITERAYHLCFAISPLPILVFLFELQASIYNEVEFIYIFNKHVNLFHQEVVNIHIHGRMAYSFSVSTVVY
jgi:hypothetical protein